MKLSTKEQYAIEAMIDLAIKYNSKLVTLTEISCSKTISVSYLEQLFSMLRKSELVQGVRGPGGGYRLAKTPGQISVMDIIFAIEESTSNNGNKNSGSNDIEDRLVDILWNSFSEQLADYLNSISLADIIKDQIVVKSQYQLDEMTRRISTMFPVSANLKVA